MRSYTYAITGQLKENAYEKHLFGPSLLLTPVSVCDIYFTGIRSMAKGHQALRVWLFFVASLRILSVVFGYIRPEMLQDGVFSIAKDQGKVDL